MASQQYQGRNQKILWDKWKWKHNDPKSMGHSEKVMKTHLKKQEISNNVTLHLKELEKEQNKVSRGKKIIKIRIEFNEIEWKKRKVKKPIVGSLKR